jgi:hypothetical protein
MLDGCAVTALERPATSAAAMSKYGRQICMSVCAGQLTRGYASVKR